MSQIPDFNDTELWVIRSALKERYGADVDVQLGDSEIRLDPAARTLTLCPVAVWSQRGANFVIFKVGAQRYRAQFYYRGYQQYGTGKPEYDDIATCVSTLLQVQSDHERDQAGVGSPEDSH